MSILAIYGLYYFLAESFIFSRIRFWIISLHPYLNELFNCAFCLGFYCSLIINFIEIKNVNIDLLLNGFAGAASTFIIQILLTYLRTISEFFYNKINS